MDKLLLEPGFLAPLLAIAMTIVWMIGWSMGYRLHEKGHPQPSKFDDASMALMGLLIAFAFGTSISKYEARRIAMIGDANAIGDFYTCATLLKEPTRSELQSVIQQYTQLRLALAQGSLDDASFDQSLAKADALFNQMVQLVSGALAQGTPISVSLTNTLNAVSSNQVSRLAAFHDRLPASIVILLLASSVVTSLLVGRQQGSDNNDDRMATLCFIALVSLALYVILDLNIPNHGSIRVSQEPIERLIAAMPH